MYAIIGGTGLAQLPNLAIGRREVMRTPYGEPSCALSFGKLAGHDIVFRVEGGAKRAAMQQPMLAFEVDHVDEDRESGWSVLVRGVGAEVDLERVPALLRAMDGHFPKPWAVGIHNVWLQIVPHTVTGRRLGAERSSW